MSVPTKRSHLIRFAQDQYEAAKQRSFEAKFGEAEAGHVASALLFEEAGEPELAARAYMRALWYRIQTGEMGGYDDLVNRAHHLSVLQTRAGVHQGIEFSLFEGNVRSFSILTTYLENSFREDDDANLGIGSSQHSWLDRWIHWSQRIYAEVVQATLESEYQSWMLSDQARLFYYSSFGDDGVRRVEKLRKAGKIFSDHGILYRSQLCNGEACLIEAAHSGSVVEAGRAAEAGLVSLQGFDSYSNGVVEYSRALNLIIEWILGQCVERGYVPLEITKNSLIAERRLTQLLEQPSGVFEPIVADLIRVMSGGALQSLESDVDESELDEDGAFEATRLAFWRRRLGGGLKGGLEVLGLQNLVEKSKDRDVVDGGDWRCYRGLPDQKKVAVFVHGLNGHFERTWGKFPELLKGDDEIREVELFFWGFPTGYIGKRPGIRRVAKALKTELMVRYSGYEMMFITFSLGGLVTKKMLVDDLMRDREEIVRRTSSVLFFAVPHLGSSLADIGAMFGSQMEELGLNDEGLVELERDWSRLFHASDRFSEIRMMYVTGLEDDVVSDWSASVHAEYQTVKGSHRTLTKPNSVRDSVYMIVREEIQKM